MISRQESVSMPRLSRAIIRVEKLSKTFND